MKSLLWAVPLALGVVSEDESVTVKLLESVKLENVAGLHICMTAPGLHMYSAEARMRPRLSGLPVLQHRYVLHVGHQHLAQPLARPPTRLSVRFMVH